MNSRENVTSEHHVLIQSSDKRFLWLCLGVWAVSFFLPAFDKTNSLFFQSGRGFEAFGYCLQALYFLNPTYGLLWLGNIFVVLAPYFARRIPQGKGRVYVPFLCIWSLYPLLLPLIHFFGSNQEIDRLRVGYYVWQASLLATATWFLWVLFRRPVILVGAAVFTVSMLLWPPLVAEHRAHLRALQGLRTAISGADEAILTYEQTGKPMRVPTWKLENWTEWPVEWEPLARRDFHVAGTYLGDLYDCEQSERVSDFSIFERYPGIPVHLPDQLQQPVGENGPDRSKSATQPWGWMSCRDIEPAALQRGKLYVHNAKVDLGMISGRRELPELVCRFEEGLAPGNDLPRRDLPARFSFVDGLVQVWRADHNPQSVKADANLLLQKGDDVQTASNGAASIIFAGGTTYILKPDSFVRVRENSTDQSGTTISKLGMDDGKVDVETSTMTWLSKAQVDVNMGTVSLGPDSALEVCGDPNNQLRTLLLTKGSAEVQLSRKEEPMKLVPHDKIWFSTEMGPIKIQKATDSEAPPPWFRGNRPKCQ